MLKYTVYSGNLVLKHELSLYIKNINENIIFIGFYVDDLIIGSPSINDLEEVKSKGNTFKMVDKEQISYFLGWEI